VRFNIVVMSPELSGTHDFLFFLIPIVLAEYRLASWRPAMTRVFFVPRCSYRWPHLCEQALTNAPSRRREIRSLARRSASKQYADLQAQILDHPRALDVTPHFLCGIIGIFYLAILRPTACASQNTNVRYR